MKVQFTTYFEDGTSGITEFEKPPGYHPSSIGVMAFGVLEAEKTGKTVARIGISKVNPYSSPGAKLVINEDLLTREEVLKVLRKSLRPMKEEFKPLFG